MTIDAKDRALIALLRENGRTPTAELARRLGLSRTTVQSRIERLENSGIIVGYSVKLSGDHEGRHVWAHVNVMLLPKFAAKVEAKLRGIPEVRKLYSVSGGFDMIVVIAAPSIGDLNTVIDDIGTLEGVERTTSAIILSTRIDR